MDKLEIHFTNCRGIRGLQHTFEFPSSPWSVAIYASNGLMKTSFANTFMDLSQGNSTRDHVFAERMTVRTIRDGVGNDLGPDDVVVIPSYDEKMGPTESTSTLLVNPVLRQEYEDLIRELDMHTKPLLNRLASIVGKKADVTALLSRSLAGPEGDFYDALVNVLESGELEKQQDFSSVEYETVFNDRVRGAIAEPEVRSALKSYVEALNRVLANSMYFRRDAFDFYGGRAVTKSLADHGFFKAHHEVLLNPLKGEPLKVKSSTQLDKLIAEERAEITSDPELRKAFDEVERVLTGNLILRKFLAHASADPQLLTELEDLDKFEQKVWKFYLSTMKDSVAEVVSCYQRVSQRLLDIEEQAKRESTIWERVIDDFNRRFVGIPFRLVTENREEVILGRESVPKLAFEFVDGQDRIPKDKSELLDVLSTGEKKALYILGVLFEVESRRLMGKQTLFIIDDLADSFDYKNKYAILEYLLEMCQEASFRIIVLTHNFDFYRVVQSRGIVSYNNCLIARRDGTGISLDKATGIKNPFVKDFKLKFYTHGMKRVACIPFMRNLVEFTRGESDQDYLTLCRALHWTPEMPPVLQSELDEMYARLFGDTGAWPDANQAFYELVFEEAEKALGAASGFNLEGKLALSIAIRLRSEQFMARELNLPGTSHLKENATRDLFNQYKTSQNVNRHAMAVLSSVLLMTPENIHLNAFMYEPMIDLDVEHLRALYDDLKLLIGVNPPNVVSA